MGLKAEPIHKPKIGVAFVTSGWFREVGLQDPSGDTTAQVEAVARKAPGRLLGFLDPVYPGVLHSVEEARQAAARATVTDLRARYGVELRYLELERLGHVGAYCVDSSNAMVTLLNLRIIVRT